jgi:hypothetical protein
MEDILKKELKDQVVKILETLSPTQETIKANFNDLKDYLKENPNLLFQHNSFHKYPVLIIKNDQKILITFLLLIFFYRFANSIGF